MRFKLKYILMFSILNNVLCSIIMSAEYVVTPETDLQEIINYKTVAASEIPELRDKSNITKANEGQEIDVLNVTIAQIAKTQNTPNVTSSLVSKLNITNVTIAENSETENAVNSLLSQYPGLNDTKFAVDQTPVTQNAEIVTALQVTGLNMTTNINVTRTSEEQNAANAPTTLEEELNAMAGDDVLISEEHGNPTNTTVNPVPGVDIIGKGARIIESINATNNITAAHMPEVNIANMTQKPTVSQISGKVNIITNTNIGPTIEAHDHDVSDTAVEDCFKKNKLVPDVVSVAPKDLVNVLFPDGRKARLGHKLAPIQVKDMPTVSWNASSNNFYILIVVDPDIPSRSKPIFRSILHWLVVNIPGDHVAAGETLAEYIGAGPPEKSGLHRLTYLVYQQPRIIRFNEIRLSNATLYGRDRFSVDNFALKYNLGNPVAGNFYKTFFDHYVTILYKRLRITKGHGNTVAPAKIVIATLVFALFLDV